MWRQVTRFLIASLLSAVAAVVVATLTLSLASLFGSEAINMAQHEQGLGEMALAMLALLPFAILIGGVIAWPTALVMGGAMVWLIAHRPQLDRSWVWAAAAALGSIPAMALVGGAYAIYPDRIVLWIWLVLSAIVGALVFRWHWGKASR